MSNERFSCMIMITCLIVWIPALLAVVEAAVAAASTGVAGAVVAAVAGTEMETAVAGGGVAAPPLMLAWVGAGTAVPIPAGAGVDEVEQAASKSRMPIIAPILTAIQAPHREENSS